jgi:predicted dehydrogenase
VLKKSKLLIIFKENKTMKIGFLGCGKMANKMAELIKDLPGCELYACAARDSLKSLSFKNTYGFIKSYGNYEELVNDKEVDLIYISTITRTHYELMKLCLKHKKNVLCEKPFTVNSLESKEVIELAHKNNVYLAEAIWTVICLQDNL